MLSRDPSLPILKDLIHEFGGENTGWPVFVAAPKSATLGTAHVTATDISIVIFADIDGALSALPRTAVARDLRALHQLGSKVAVVLCSGRTRPEIEHLSQELGARHPFICEHGAAAFVPSGYFPFDVPDTVPVAAYQVMEFGRSSASIIELLKKTAERQGVAVRCFSEMSVEEVARDCEMSLLRARLAKLRDYGELFRVVDPNPDARPRLLDALRAAHVRCVVGQPFDHVGASVDISIGVGMLRTLYRRLRVPTITVGIADWLAEGDLLQLVECPVVIEGEHGTSAPRHVRRSQTLRVVPFGGRTNWADSIVQIVRELASFQPARS
jgi:predicted mannosyl-3-phosphoglycerate phosphatase (HAD superfamily)